MPTPGSSHTIAIVAALEREVWPLVREWTIEEHEFEGSRLKFFLAPAQAGTRPRAVVVCGGIGARKATLAAAACLALYRPAALVSAGFAGSLKPGAKGGQVFRASQVVDAATLEEYLCDGEYFTLVSAATIAGGEAKRDLAQRFAADAVDMEAASVARAAKAARIPFVALKAISDELDFPMPPLGQFVDVEGRFSTPEFLSFAIRRPRIWPTIFRLIRNSAKAAQALGQALHNLISQQAFGGDSGRIKSSAIQR